METGPQLVAPYCGQSQTSTIDVPVSTHSPEEGPWAMLPYSFFYPQPPEPGTAFVPPPVQKTALWDAMQTWPLPQPG